MRQDTRPPMRATFGLPDRSAALKRFRRASATFDDADAVHSEARARLLARLPLFKLNPMRIVDLGAATGKTSAELATLYPDARILAMDLCWQMSARTAARCRRLDRVATITCDAERMPLREGSIDLIFANLLLPWCDPGEVFRETARVLRDGGLLLFTTVGPDTLAEVRQAWSEVDDGLHVHGFVDMHDLGDLASRSGLAEPVLDVDRLTVTYPDVGGLVSDLRACGATNVAHGRRSQLTGRSRWNAFRERLAARRAAQDNAGRDASRDSGHDDPRHGGDGSESGEKLFIGVELIYGQAWGAGRGAGRGTATAPDTVEAAVPVEELRRMLRG